MTPGFEDVAITDGREAALSAVVVAFKGLTIEKRGCPCGSGLAMMVPAQIAVSVSKTETCMIALISNLMVVGGWNRPTRLGSDLGGPFGIVQVELL